MQPSGTPVGPFVICKESLMDVFSVFGGLVSGTFRSPGSKTGCKRTRPGADKLGEAGVSGRPTENIHDFRSNQHCCVRTLPRSRLAYPEEELNQ